MFGNTTVDRNTATSHILNSMTALAGCWIATAVAIAPLMPADGKLTLVSRSRLEERVTLAPPYGMQRVATTDVAPVGAGWG